MEVTGVRPASFASYGSSSRPEQAEGKGEDTAIGIRSPDTVLLSDKFVKKQNYLHDSLHYRWSESNPAVTIPKNFALDLVGASFQNIVRPAFKAYYRYGQDQSVIDGALSKYIAETRAIYADLGVDPQEFTAQLIQDTCENARLENIGAAGEASWLKGLPMAASQYGGNENVRSWVYYDSDFYYKSEEMKRHLVEVCTKIGEKYGITELDLPTEYADDDIRKGMYSSYNTYTNWKTREFHRIASIVDETKAPPKGFRFLYTDNQTGTNQYVQKLPVYKADRSNLFDGCLKVWYGDYEFTGRVPVRQNMFTHPISVNMLDIMELSDKAIPEKLKDFLKNVDFFSPILSTEYMNRHPRKY